MRIPLLALVIVACSLSAPAQGLVQIGFEGEIEPTGGARVESEIRFVDRGTGRQQTLSLALLLGERTSAVDFAGLLARRLEQAGARVVFTGSTAPTRGPANLFVEDVTAVGLQLGHGLNAAITLCEDRPGSIKLTPSIESPLGASLTVVAQTLEPHAHQPGKLALDMKIDERADATDAGTQMVKLAIDKGWFSELEGHETWRPGPTTDGGNVTSCSLNLRSNTDWRIDVTLAPRNSQR